MYTRWISYISLYSSWMTASHETKPVMICSVYLNHTWRVLTCTKKMTAIGITCRQSTILIKTDWDTSISFKGVGATLCVLTRFCLKFVKLFSVFSVYSFSWFDFIMSVVTAIIQLNFSGNQLVLIFFFWVDCLLFYDTWSLY